MLRQVVLAHPASAQQPQDGVAGECLTASKLERDLQEAGVRCIVTSRASDDPGHHTPNLSIRQSEFGIDGLAVR